MNRSLTEFAYAWRALKASPASALAAIAILAAALGCNAAIYTLAQSLEDAPPAGRHAERTYIVGAEPRDPQFESFEMLDSGFVETLEQRLESFETLSRIRSTWVSLTSIEQPQIVGGIRAGKGFLRAIGVEMELGRTFRDEDFEGGEPVAALSFDGWRSLFGGRPDILDETVSINGVPHRIVGVLPETFSFERWRFSIVAASSYADGEMAGDNPQFTWLVGRLKDGVEPRQAQLELSALEPQLAGLAKNLGFLDDRSLRLKKLNAFENSFVDKQIFLLVAVGTAVLLISALNVANLALARLNAKGAELATRFALGATRWDVARMSLWENGILTLASYVLGLGVGAALIQVVSRHFAGANWGLLEALDGDLSLDGATLAITAAACVASVGLISLTTTLFSGRARIGSYMRQDSRTATSSAGFNRVTSGLLFLEIAFTCALLIVGGFFFASLERIRNFDYGYEMEDLRLANVNLPFYRFEEGKDAGELMPIMDAALKRVAAIPEIQEASLAKIHFPHRGYYDWIRLPDTPAGLEGARLPQAWKSTGSPGYIELLGLRKLAGEDFSEAENRRDAEPTIVVSESFARTFFPEGDAIGQFVESDLDGEVMTFRIIGIVSDVRRWWRARPVEPTFYFANANDRGSRNWANLYMRSDSWSPALERRVLDAIFSVDSEIIITVFENIAEEEGRSQSSFRFIVFMQSLVGGIGFALCCAGIYSSVSHAIERQRREIGVRLALGATPASIRNRALGRAALLVAPAVAVGAGVAWALLGPVGAFRDQLHLVDPASWEIYAAGCGALLAVSFAATWLPARRASRIDPNEALQEL